MSPESGIWLYLSLLIASGWMPERVQVSPDQSSASRSVVKYEGKLGNGSSQPDGSRMQALYPKGIRSLRLSPAGHRAPKNQLS